MSKEIDLIKCIIFEIDKSLYSDFGGNLCISYTPNLKKLLLALNTPEVRYYFDNQDQKIKDLEAKLAEKEKEISEYIKIVDDLHKQLSDKCDFCDKTKDQDKISFAVEQLEKVKELLNTDFESIISWIDPYEDGECLTSMTYNHNNTIKIIDNQIKQLKGE